MVATDCSQIAPRENTLGRHYSRFWPILPNPSKQFQSLAQSENPKIDESEGESAKFG
jgi:hypothetical protein